MFAVLTAILLVLGAFPAAAQAEAAPKWTAMRPPRFEDFPVQEPWDGNRKPLKLLTRSERMFRTNLSNAASEEPNFAGRYRFAFWGCGANCAAGALIDLSTGEVFQPPLTLPNATGWDRWIIGAGMLEGSGIDHRADSRLVVVRGGANYSERTGRNIPDVSYHVWERDRFRQILFVSGKQPRR